MNRIYIRKTVSLFIGLIVASLVYAQQIELGNLNVIPQPQEVVVNNLSAPFLLKKGIALRYDSKNEGLNRIANFLSEYIKDATGVTISPINRTRKAIQEISLSIDSTLLSKEAYQINITPQHIAIVGGSEAGLFYGVQTIRKALPLSKGSANQAAIPSGIIKDAPRFSYRGFLVDVGRHYFPISYIKEMIDMFALHNINHFHWHLTDDQGWRIEIKKYPKLTQIGSHRDSTLINWEPRIFDKQPVTGFYTQEEAREIIRYAAERYITVIPEIDLPGHMMAALVSYPELGCTGGPYTMPCGWGVFSDVLCGGKAKTLQFAKDVLNEIMDLFPSPYIHIGGDECPKERWKGCATCQNKIKELGLEATAKHSKENQLQTYFMGEIGALIASRGRKMMGWDEMLEGGLTPGATVMSWTSYKPAIETAHLHHDVIITPIQYLYFSNPNYNKIYGIKSIERIYNFDPLPKEIPSDEQKYVIGAQGCVWTEWTRDSLKMEWQIFPRMAALAEIQWTQPSNKDFESFIKRINHQLAIYKQQNYYFRPDILAPTMYCKYIGNKTFEVEMRTIDNAEIRYTIDGQEPTPQSKIYNGIIKVSAPATLKAIAIRNGMRASEVSKETLTLTSASRNN